MLLEEHRYKTENNILYQNYQSVKHIKKNVNSLCTGDYRHIKYDFIIKDIVDKNEASIKYCPTEWMLANFFTKLPLGELFRRFSDIIMENNHIP